MTDLANVVAGMALATVILGLIWFFVKKLFQETADHDGFWLGGMECDITRYVERLDEGRTDPVAKAVDDSRSNEA